MRKRMIGLLCAALLLFGCTGAVWADNTITINGDNNTVIFVDVPEGYWARDDIQYFASQHIVEGYGDGQFKPQDNVTREQFTKMLVLTFQAELESPQQPSFSDVSKDRWSYPYIEVCKEFLTGYANPFGGLPAYHPEEIATREDIAVALVRMIGLTDKDGKDKNCAATKFSDAQEVSPALLPYVSIAAERGLINGYPDGTFQPNGGITRAETVVLLNRATKQAVTDIESELLLEVALLPGNDARNVTLKITTEEGAAVTVDGKRVATSADSNGNYVGTYAYTFTQEGSKTFMVTASKGGKTKRASTSAEYKADAPVLRITSCPATTAEQQVEIAGTIYDGNYPATLTIGGQPVATGTAGPRKTGHTRPN